MQKLFACMLLAAGILGTAAVSAQNLDPEDVTVQNLKEIVSEHYDCKIENGDLHINSDGKIFVAVLPKAKLIQIYAIFSLYKERSNAEMTMLANKFNDEKRFIRVSIQKDGCSFCDCYMVYDGGLSGKNFLESIAWFIALRKSWNDYVVNGGDKE